MNIFIQNILVFIAIVLAVAFLVRKFFFKKSNSKNPGSIQDCGEDDCSCH